MLTRFVFDKLNNFKGGAMKKLLVLTIMLMFGVFLFADCYLNNGNMESWTTNGSSGPPDNWALGGGTGITATQEGTTIHGGNYSTNLTWTTDTTVRLEQVSISVTAGNDYEFCFYAYDNDPDGRVRVVIRWYDNTDTFISGYYGDYTTDTAGWQYLRSGSQTAPSGAVTAHAEIRCYDVSGWDGNATVYVDDATFCDNECLSVELSSFYAIYNQDQLTLHWKTYSETNNQGWNVYRSVTNDFNTAEKINIIQIPGHGTTSQTSEYVYTDVKQVENNKTYYYWIESVENSGNTELYNPISININNEDNQEHIPDIPSSVLLQNYPNPFNPVTWIKFDVPEGKNSTITIFNLKGEKVLTLFDGISKGKNIIKWDGKDKNGKIVPSGIYFYRLNSEDANIMKKMILAK